MALVRFLCKELNSSYSGKMSVCAYRVQGVWLIYDRCVNASEWKGNVIVLACDGQEMLK